MAGIMALGAATSATKLERACGRKTSKYHQMTNIFDSLLSQHALPLTQTYVACDFYDSQEESRLLLWDMDQIVQEPAYDVFSSAKRIHAY